MRITTGDVRTAARPLAFEIILEEHRSIRAALQTMIAALPSPDEPQDSRLDLPTVHAVIAYLDSFPERIHHPKEDDTLFDLLERRDADAAALIGALREEHVYVQSAMRTLQREADALSSGAPGALARFRATVDSFDQFYRAHMQVEEAELLPIALRIFSAADWQSVDTVFAGNLDPLRGGEHAQAFTEQLKSTMRLLPRIVI